MSETTMNVTLIAHTQLSKGFDLTNDPTETYDYTSLTNRFHCTAGQVVALTAIRTCYAPLYPTEIAEMEGDKYFNRDASDGGVGKESDRLFRQIVASGHTSTVEHLTFTFAIEGVSRALLAQLTRHRVGFSFSVQSQRYVKLGSNDKSGGFDYIVPNTITSDKKCVTAHKTVPDMGSRTFKVTEMSAQDIFDGAMEYLQTAYDRLRQSGVPAEDARAVLPNATATNLVMTANLRALLDFYGKRRKGRGAQAEIANLAERLRECVVEAEPWTDQFFEVA